MVSSSATTSSESRLADAWAALRRRGGTALIPYLTAGHPSPAGSLEAIRAADELADVLEVGVPFSDPLADGPTIQRATFAALHHGVGLPQTLELIARAAPAKPVVVFSYLNPILRYGVARFLRDAGAVGVAGVLLTDLPAGADPALEEELAVGPLDLIRLVAPTTRPERVARALTGARGFVYLIARLGVTGASVRLADDLADSVARVRRATPLPVAVGFGLSTPEQAAAVARLADGVVVGSALVDRLEREGTGGARRFLAELRGAIDRVEKPRAA
ncbi:MAG TPA: tryptophan synthase subunit alpha [Gemmatimonadales bacterium]|nr:tryptophan synthase subunit alpha [Gemmatimonadales bacterium]